MFQKSSWAVWNWLGASLGVWLVGARGWDHWGLQTWGLVVDGKYQLVILGDNHTRVTFWYVHRSPSLQPAWRPERGRNSIDLLFSSILSCSQILIFPVHKRPVISYGNSEVWWQLRVAWGVTSQTKTNITTLSNARHEYYYRYWVGYISPVPVR